MSNLPLLQPPEHVLSTLEADGSRRWLSPKLSMGSWWRRRRVVAYSLIGVFVLIPHLRLNEKPLVLLDIPARQFTLFGHTFLPTDTVLLALLLLAIFLAIVLATAVTGRVWCGWACPQTVYMEYLFRPIDRFFTGTKGRGGKPKHDLTGWRSAARYAAYVVLSMFLAHTFLAYFVGTERLAQWVRSSPVEHPMAFFVMGMTTIAMLFDFLFFREQLCLIACPYGRFQSVMLDRSSLIVGYDPGRGEPRKKGKRSHKGSQPNSHQETAADGDCIDCKQCVVVCPTGIDIRDGLQMECINCTQCIDACDTVMEKVGLPKGLIRYSSQDALDGKPTRFLRARTFIYPFVLAGVVIAFVAVLSTKFAFDASIIRATGNPFMRTGPSEIANQFRLRLVNRSNEVQMYKLTVSQPPTAKVTSDAVAGVELEPGDNELIPVTIQIPMREFGPNGRCTIDLKIHDESGNEKVLETKLLGPSI